ncbi:MAG: osmoprotectant transport system substrate-binding protein [Pseudonocardiales bacterium]|jgi:osmoprotectant transport system substrate-binding protein|nr:osmoprotectant transport system substrate-binding protein [Pseudonocardiales bacterium]MDT4977202.1 osmoprotectant transport system substrate-binding protein [Pseudonocardiales bacterium]
MKRIYLVPAAVLSISLALAGCGSKGSSNKTAAPGGGTTAAPTTSGSGSSTASAAPLPTSTATYPAGTGSITIGSAGFSENEILAEIYAGAMQAKGVKVSKKLSIGERPLYIAALKDGSIDFIPEYSGSILSFLDPKATAKTPADVYTALEAAVPATEAVLNPSAAQDSDTITVTKATADKNNLKTIGDLAPVASGMTLGAPQQFQTRADGVPALKTVYGVTFGTFTPLQAGGAITVTALKNGTVDAADIFSTDPSIAANNFVSLIDDKSMFAAQNIVPLVNKAKMTQTIADAANAVSAKLDTKTLAELVGKVQNDKQTAAAVAKAWLTSVGLG